jgi:Fur family transcriptional regulator, ferric uptake regulator
MNSMSPKQILLDNNLRITNCRKDVLNTFLDRQSALSHSDLEEVLSKDFDRVTLYRTLKTFLDNDLIHKVLDDSGSTKYALCSHSSVGVLEHDHEHVHFKCEKCGKTMCIEGTSLPKIKLPDGYINKEANLLIQGICDKCN